MFKPVVVNADSFREQAAHQQSDASAENVANVFKVLHGFYGNLFLSKFASGQVDESGADQGVTSAKSIWAHGLRKYGAGVVKTALNSCLTAHPQFPPSLPEFVALCAAHQPRQTYAEENNLPRLAAPAHAAPVELVDFKPKGDMKDWARRLMARHDAGEILKPIQLRYAREALGIRVEMGAA